MASVHIETRLSAIRHATHTPPCLFILLMALLLVGGCTSPDIRDARAPAGDPAAAVLTLPGGRSHTVYPERLAFTGSARLEWPDGRVYEGDFLAGQPDGMGIETRPDGEQYRGTWRTGRKHGHGELNRPDGSRYRGDFVAGQRQGIGVEESGEGLYQGRWEGDLPQGPGQFHGSDGSRYEGQWVAGRRQGYGTYTDARGSVYRGNWQHDVPEGFGVLEHPDGSRYQGEWHGGRQHGYGRARTPAGVVYEGTWVEGARQGFGVAERPDGSRYEGEWFQGQRQGQGRETYADGSWHDGAWEADRPLGPGTRRDRTGIEISGVWTGDAVSAGLMRLPSGAEYAGPLLVNGHREIAEGLLSWLASQAESGDPHAHYFLGTAYSDYEWPEPDAFRAIRHFRAAARAGLPDAQLRLALKLLDSTPEQAIDWLEKAAAAGHGQANTLLGELYLTGTHVTRDLERALACFEAASAAGDPTGRTNLAWILATTERSEIRDPVRALELVRPLALLKGEWQHLDTLAAAYAALDRYADAREAQSRALTLAIRALGADSAEVRAMEQRLARYDTPPSEPSGPESQSPPTPPGD